MTSRNQDAWRDTIIISILLVVCYQFLINTIPLYTFLSLNALKVVLALDGVIWIIMRWRNNAVWRHVAIGLVTIIAPSFIHPIAGIAFGGLSLTFLTGMLGEKDQPQEIKLRGNRAASIAPRKHYRQQMKLDDPGFFWGSMLLPIDMATRNMLVIGTVGSGKTLTINMFMRSVFHLLVPGSQRRAIVFDPKQEVYPIIRGIGPFCPIYILNPMDQRCTAWDMARDITDPLAAQAMARILVPQDEGSKDPFWRNSVAVLMLGIIVWFIRHAPGAWTLRDILLIMRDDEIVKAILASDKETQHYLKPLADSKVAANIGATISTKLVAFEPIAACWHQAESSFSLHDDWLESGSILILGEFKSSPEPIRAVNQVIFTRAAQLLLDQPEQAQQQNLGPSTYIVLDEAPAMGKLNKLKDLATEGRSKGVSLTLGFQEVDDMRKVYGREDTTAILGQCNCKSFLRLSSAETAEWASRLFSEREFMDISFSENTNADNPDPKQSITKSWNRRTTKVVMPIELMSIPPTGPQHGLKGFYQVQGQAFSTQMPWYKVMELQPKRTDDVAFMKRPGKDYWLQPFTEGDMARLNLEWLADEILDDSEFEDALSKEIPY